MSKELKPGPAELKGNTMRVYLYLLRSGASELRDVQRDLGFSTPSLASYHLGRLMEAGYVTQNPHGQYLVESGSTGQILEGFTHVGALVVPQLFFFAVLFTGVAGFFAVMSLWYPSYVPLLVATSLAMIVVIWYETVRVWRRLAAWK